MAQSDLDITELEARLAARTEELSQANARLAEEIARRARAEQALREREAFVGPVVHTAGLAVIGLAPDGTISEWNETAELLCGHLRDETVGQPYERFVPEPLRPGGPGDLRAALAGQRIRSIETRLTAADGKPVIYLWEASRLSDPAGRPIGVLCMGHNVTGKRLGSAALAESERRHRSLVQTAGSLIVMLSPAGQVLEWNPEAERVFGYRREQMLALDSIEGLIPEEYRPQVMAAMGKVLAGTDMRGYATPIPLADGRMHTFLWNGTRLIDEQGRVAGILSIGQDITELKETEQALRRSEEQYRLHFEYANDAICSLDRQLRITSISPSVERILGIRPAELVGRGLLEANLLAPHSVATATQAAHRVLGGESISALALDFLHRDGRQVFGEVSGAPWLAEGGEVAGLVVVARDVTDRKQAEAALAARERQLRILVRAMPDLVFIFDEDGRYVEVMGSPQNPLYPAAIEYKGRQLGELHFRGQGARYLETVREVIRTRKPQTISYTAQPYGRGPHYHCEARVAPIGRLASGKQAAIWVERDVTERLRTERALQQRDDQIRATANALPDLIFLFDEEGRYVDVFGSPDNPLYQHVLAYKGKRISEAGPAVPRDKAEQFQQAIDRVLAEGRAITIEYSAIPPWGRPEMHFEARIAPMGRLDSGRRAVIWLERDISDRKRAEQALRESETRYRTLVEQLPAITYISALDTSRAALYVSPQVESMLGVSPAQCQADPDIRRKLLHPADRARVLAELSACKAAGRPFALEYRMVRRDGQVRWVRDEAVVVRDENGAPLFIQGILRDVTERREAEEQLRRSEATTRALLDAIPDTICRILRDGTHVDCIPSEADGSAIAPEQIVGKRLQDVMPDWVHRPVMRAVRRALRTGQMQPLEFELPGAPGESRGIYEGRFVPVQAQGREEVMGIVRNITERKRTEEALRDSEERMRAVTAALPDRVLVLDEDGRYVDVLAHRGWGLKTSAADIVGKRLDEVVSADLARQCLAVIRRTLRSGRGQTIEYELPGPRARRWMEGRTSPMKATRDGKRLVVWVARDITERKRAADQLLRYQRRLRSLTGQMALVEERQRRQVADELHDHIGQTLALSKIKVDEAKAAQPAPSGPVCAALTEVSKLLEQTIESTRTLVFQLSPPILYELGFEPAVEWLCEQVQRQHGILTRFRTDRRDKPLDEDVRVLLFQGVRELLVNVVKHARTRTAMVAVRCAGDKVRVCVQDKGVGFDPAKAAGARGRPRGFGLFSLRERLEPLGGGIDIQSQRGKGTRVILTAPLRRQPEQGGNP